MVREPIVLSARGFTVANMFQTRLGKRQRRVPSVSHGGSTTQNIRRRGGRGIIGQAMRRARRAALAAHWYGTSLVSTGSDLRTAQTLLRHTNLQTSATNVRVKNVPKQLTGSTRSE
jgi:site-specific recombinase XerD